MIWRSTGDTPLFAPHEISALYEIYFNALVRYFVWNLKDSMWDSIHNIVPIRAGVLILGTRTRSTRELNFCYSYFTHTREFQSNNTRTCSKLIYFVIIWIYDTWDVITNSITSFKSIIIEKVAELSLSCLCLLLSFVRVHFLIHLLVNVWKVLLQT